MQTESIRIPSPIDELKVPEALVARVVEPGSEPRIHGYDVQSDLAAHYDFGEIAFIALTGVPPSESIGRAFNAILGLAAPISVAEAPAHAALIAQLGTGAPHAVMTTAAVGVTEQMRAFIEEHGAVFDWLEGEGDVALVARSGSSEERAAVHRLRAIVGAHGVDLGTDADVGWWPAMFCALHRCGLQRREQILSALCMARWPVAVAEALAAPAFALREYPMRTPPFFITRD